MNGRSFVARRAAASPSPAAVTLRRKCACGETGGNCPRCASKRMTLQRHGTGRAPAPRMAPGEMVGDVLRASGEPLPTATRAWMEDRLDHDFSGVRIHADARARRSAAAVDARAYTVGEHVALGEPRPDFESPAGRRLLGHELAHVVQQSRGGVGAGIDPDPALESEARQVGDAIAVGRRAHVGGASPPVLAREPKRPSKPPREAAAQGSSLDDYLREMDENEALLARENYADATYTRVSESIVVDGVPIADRTGIYDSSGLYTAKNPELDEIVALYRQAAGRDAARPSSIDSHTATQKAGDEGPLVGNEIIIIHDVATEAEKSRRAGLSPNIQTFDEFKRIYQKEHGTAEGAEQAFFAYHDAESAKLFEGYRRIDAAAGAVNWIAGATVGVVASGFDPVAVFGPMAVGKGVELGARAVGVDKETASAFGDLAEFGAGFAIPSLAHGSPTTGSAARAEAKSAGVATQAAERETGALETGTLESGAGKSPLGAPNPVDAGAVETIERQAPRTRPAGDPGAPSVKPPSPDADLAHKPLAEPESLGDGHHTQITARGVERCSPEPCPVLRVAYQKELAADPALQKEMKRLDALSAIAAAQERSGKLDPAFVKRINREGAELERKLAAMRAGVGPAPRPPAGGAARAAKVAGRPGIPSPEGFVDEAIARLDDPDAFSLHVGEKAAEKIKSGEKPFVLDQPVTRGDIDEPLAVGAPGVKPQRAVDRALDPHNRQFLDPATNRRTKYLGTDPRDVARGRQKLDPVSLKDDPDALFTRRFDETTEMAKIFDEAVNSVQNKGKMSPTELKNAINRKVSSIIKEGASTEAHTVRDVLVSKGFVYRENVGWVAGTGAAP
ncbi:DUF4157 domain-containing protein [Methylocystis sp. IM3]|uniref:eCIS core domain-containing protein n=1 Tax=Methylocystis sp. IM3 TaxID=3136722 RepID=UPI0031199A78